MATTIDYTRGATIGVAYDSPKAHVLKRVLDVPTMIAEDATLLAAATITATDIIQAIDVPADFWLFYAMFEVITAHAATVTADIGLAGGQEIAAGVDMATAGTEALMAYDGSWGPAAAWGKHFTSADTIDVEYLTADTTVGRSVLQVVGFNLAHGVSATSNPYD